MAESFGDGSRTYQQRAKQILPILVARAQACRDITYGQLAKEIGAHHRSLAYSLGAIGNELKNLSNEWKEAIPPINCLVVNKQKGTPGLGISFAMSLSKFKALPSLVKRQLMRGIYAQVWGYTRWDDVLEHFNLEPVSPATMLEPMATAAKYGKSGGGEGAEHELLKTYLAQHPEVLGLAGHRKPTVEYAFISADRIDLLFRAGSTWTGVEVKPSNADEPELMRGIFQCVKYRALIEATQRFESRMVDVQVVFATGRKLPLPMLSLCDLLEVEVADGVTVPASFSKRALAAKAGR